MASIRELQMWIAEHIKTRLSVDDLADRMSMSAPFAELRALVSVDDRLEEREPIAEALLPSFVGCRPSGC
jgi:hypothetical protein